MNCTVIIVTLNRPECVRRCVQCLLAQQPAISQIIVVDASADARTRTECEQFAEVLYLRHELGEARTTHGRNLGVKHATGDMIAFLDDDAYVREGWLAALLMTYGDDPQIGAVGGRALRHTPDEETEGVTEIGLLTKDGSLTGFFGADPGKVIEVDHLIGCNMSFRREVIGRFGGFRAGFETRYCIREESDIFMIMKKCGYRILFDPAAVVDHMGAPKPRGKRFDVSWDYFGHRNHYVLLMRNYGLFDAIVWRHFAASLWRAAGVFGRDFVKASIRLLAVVTGTAAGLAAGAYYTVKQGSDPVRRDAEGIEISRALLRPAPPTQVAIDQPQRLREGQPAVQFDTVA
jgi:GT2 family glycosyltransferase